MKNLSTLSLEQHAMHCESVSHSSPLQRLEIKGSHKEIDAFTMEDLELLHYTPHKKIAMQMAV